MVFSITSRDTMAHDEFQEEEKSIAFKSKAIPAALQRGETIQRRGSNGNSLNLTNGGANVRTPSFRDKLSKFKESSFRRSMKFTAGNRMDSFSDPLKYSNHVPVVSEKRKVTFVKSHKNVVHEIESCSDLQKDKIWWTAEELAAGRLEGYALALSDSSVKKYINAYEQAQREVQTCRKLSSEFLKELVFYLSKGYLGLEAQLNANVRIDAIREHVLSVVRYNHEQSIDSSSRSFGSISSQSTCSIVVLNDSMYDIRSRNIRTYSSKMSASNRNLATAMGNVAYLASIS